MGILLCRMGGKYTTEQVLAISGGFVLGKRIILAALHVDGLAFSVNLAISHCIFMCIVGSGNIPLFPLPEIKHEINITMSIPECPAMYILPGTARFVHCYPNHGQSTSRLIFAEIQLPRHVEPSTPRTKERRTTCKSCNATKRNNGAQSTTKKRERE